jgi:hypothetical protein
MPQKNGRVSHARVGILSMSCLKIIGSARVAQAVMRIYRLPLNTDSGRREQSVKAMWTKVLQREDQYCRVSGNMKALDRIDFTCNLTRLGV